MSDLDPAWMGQGFEQRKPAPRMKAVLAAIDGGAPLGLLGSTYWTASRERHRDAAKSAAELLREAQARAGNPEFVVTAFDVASSEEAHGIFLPLLREVLAATGNPDAARALARGLRQLTGHDAEAREVLERAVAAHPEYDDLRRDLAWQIVHTDPNAAVDVLDGLTERVPIDAMLRRQAAIAGNDHHAAHEYLDDFRAELGADDIGAAMEAAAFLRAQREPAQAAQVLRGTHIPARHIERARDWVELMATVGLGQEAARQVRERFGTKIPPLMSVEVFLHLQPFDEELALAGLEVAFGAVNPEAVTDLKFRRLLLAKEWDKAMQVARSHPTMWLDFAEACTEPGLARVGRIGMRKAFARGPRIVGVEHQAALAANKPKDALKKVAEIERDYEVSHLGPERRAWSLALAGNGPDAVAAGALAVARDPFCARAAWAHALALAVAGRWEEAEAESRRHHTIRAFGTKVTYADLILEAGSGGALLEELIAWHDVPKPTPERTAVYELLRERARATA